MKNHALKHYILWGLLIAGLATELAFQTSYKNYFGVFISPVIWMIGGLTVAFAAFGLRAFKKPDLQQNTSSNDPGWLPVWWRWIALPILFFIGVYWCGGFLAKIFDKFPIEVSRSDIIPSLELYVKRFLAGDVVYRPLNFGSYYVDPTYFPLLWAPYIFSELLQIDYRWTAYLVFLLAIFCYQYKLTKQSLPILEWLAKLSIPFIWIYYFIIYDEGTFGMAVELLPVGFYLFLTLSVYKRQRWLMALGILICLLSRYAFTFWLPVYMLIYWIEYGFKNVFTVSFYVLLGVIGLYIIPFLSKDWMILKKGLDYYEKTAVGQWQTQPWQPEGERPHHLNQGLSFAAYFYEHTEYSIADRLKRNRKFHITACAITALLILLGYFYFRNKGLDTRFYLLVALKVYLVVFYGFFYVPFSYLYKLPLFMSIPLLYQIRFLPSKSAKEA